MVVKVSLLHVQDSQESVQVIVSMFPGRVISRFGNIPQPLHPQVFEHLKIFLVRTIQVLVFILQPRTLLLEVKEAKRKE